MSRSDTDPESGIFHDCLDALDNASTDTQEALPLTTSGNSMSPRGGWGECEPDGGAGPQHHDARNIDNDNSGAGPTPFSASSDSAGSSLPAAIFNFTNCIVGAGCIGLGGAIAMSGGLVSVALILFFAYLTKVSLDLVVRLSVQTEGARGSYEDLAQVVMGVTGRLVVMACKFSYSFGCLVAYVIVIKDNGGPALKSLMYGSDDADNRHGHNTGIDGWVHYILSQNALFTWVISSVFTLPLCLLRDMTPLAFASLVSVASMVMIVAIVVYIYFARPDVRGPSESFYEMWLEVRPGVLNSLGTFVFTFVSQHTVHLVFASLKPKLRTVNNWRIVSSFSILAATVVSLLVGVVVYMTFGSKTKSDIFQIYPQGWMIDLAKLLLCTTMVFTFPLPFFTCRELLIVTVIHPLCGIDLATGSSRDVDDENNSNNVCGGHRGETNASPPASRNCDLQRPLLEDEGRHDNVGSIASDASPIGTGDVLTNRLLENATPRNWLLPDDNRQLQLVGHVFVTIKLWAVATGLAVAAPNLGDILDLVGCASGTLIAFVIPAVLSLRIEGYSHLAMLILAVGSAVGTVGTYYGIKQIVHDLGGL
jgi:amino acid permease